MLWIALIVAGAIFLYWKREGIVKLFNKKKAAVEDQYDDLKGRFDGDNDE